jgi:hypothetical protein
MSIALAVLLAAFAGAAAAEEPAYREELVTTAVMPSGETLPYILDHRDGRPHYVLILFPGGTGIVDPRMVNGKLEYRARTNFLLRVRPLIVDDEFATAIMNTTPVAERVQVLLDDLARRFPGTRIYLVGTSRGTFATIALAEYLSDKVAGEIHTSSIAAIGSFDARRYKNRHLVVHHVDDQCAETPFGAAQRSHDRYGTELLAMKGGAGVGDPCQPLAHHGYNGIEKETVDAIKEWVRKGG